MQKTVKTSIFIRHLEESLADERKVLEQAFERASAMVVGRPSRSVETVMDAAETAYSVLILDNYLRWMKELLSEGKDRVECSEIVESVNRRCADQAGERFSGGLGNMFMHNSHQVALCKHRQSWSGVVSLVRSAAHEEEMAAQEAHRAETKWIYTDGRRFFRRVADDKFGLTTDRAKAEEFEWNEREVERRNGFEWEPADSSWEPLDFSAA